MSQAVPSQSTASAFYQNTARPNVSKAVLSQSTARPYFPRPVFSTSIGQIQKRNSKDMPIIASGCSGQYRHRYKDKNSQISKNDKEDNIASALVGLATNQKFNFSKLIFDGLLRNLKDRKPFLMYPSLLSKKKKLKKAHKKKSSSFKQGRKKVSNGSTGLNEVDVNSGDSQMMDVDENISFIQDDTLIVDTLVNITRPRRGAGITIPDNISEKERPESPTEILDPKDEGKGIMKEEPKKKKKLTLQQLRAAETANDEEVARKVAAEWEEEEERKRLTGLERLQAELEDNEMIAAEKMNKPIKEMNVKAEEPSKKRKGTIRKMKSSRKIKKRKIQKSDDEAIRIILKLWILKVDSAQEVEVIGTPRLILHGDLTTMMETTEESDDELWRNQTEWEIIRWRLYESTGVHILELENGTMIHMLVEQRYPLTRELMQRMLEHKLEVQKETEDALNVIRFVKQKEDLEREEE
ncbi:hypothetical protein Tco_1509650 [Tanacetum coccineum]